MRYKEFIIILVLGILRISLHAQISSYHPVPFSQVNINDSFWQKILETNAEATLKVNISQISDSTSRIQNFERAAGLKEGNHEGIYYDDSDVYKAMEGIAYSLINNPNPEYEALLDKWIELIAKSQDADGYLNTYYTLNHPPESRYTDMEKHEMYCGGHMIEAAISHYRATGKTTFLDVAVKYADHLDNTFGPGKMNWVPGHQEIELALVKLYHVTDERRYLDLAYWLLEQRGRGYGKGRIWDIPRWGAAYCQDDVPVSEISNVTGHAVRAMYMYTGMADVAAALDVPGYVAALERVGESVVHRNMYITGGIGSSRSNEGFAEDYYLPNKTAYCETCASIGMVFWNNRMNLLGSNSKYADVMERSLYNGVLAGVSLEGGLFFYVNPLESDGGHHRRRWYGTACCPSNIARFIPSVGNYIYMTGNDQIFVNLFIGSETSIEIGDARVDLIQKTDYPWDGKIDFEVSPSGPVFFALNLRVPGWCKSYSVTVNGEIVNLPVTEDGYLGISRDWMQGDRVSLVLDMPVELVSADVRVKENVGKRAVQRGPLVYCLEQADNGNINFDEVKIDQNITFTVTGGEGKLSDMKVLTARSLGQELKFIPYFAWDNRDPGRMKVWIDFEERVSLYR